MTTIFGEVFLRKVRDGGMRFAPSGDGVCALRRGCYAHTTCMYMPERGRPAGLSLSDLALSLSGGEIIKSIPPHNWQCQVMSDHSFLHARLS